MADVTKMIEAFNGVKVETSVGKTSGGHYKITFRTEDGDWLGQFNLSKSATLEHVEAVAEIGHEIHKSQIGKAQPRRPKPQPKVEPVAETSAIGGPKTKRDVALQCLAMFEAGKVGGAKQLAKKHGLKYHGGPAGNDAVLAEWNEVAFSDEPDTPLQSSDSGELLAALGIDAASASKLKQLLAALG